jgi:hypothetical protein
MVLYGYETWFVSCTEESSFRIFKDKMVRKILDIRNRNKNVEDITR